MEKLIHSEQDRLEALQAYRFLGSEHEKLFDDITRLASQICDTPISLVSLVEEHRQWFRSKVGLSIDETPREYSICSYAIQTPAQPFIVEDLTKDERFKNFPLVKGDPHASFYAGVPLVDSSGFALGALCVVDTKPRKLSQEQVFALTTLSKSVVALMEQSKRSSLFNYVYDSLHSIINFGCPYFLFIDKNGLIRRFGSNFKYCLVGLDEHASFDDFFEWEGVFKIQDVFTGQSAKSSNLLFYKIKETNLRFKGAYLSFEDFIIILSTPVINAQTGINDFGITLKDIPKHDYLSEYLFLQQTTSRSLLDAQNLTEKIRQRNRELQEAQEEIKSISLFPSENPNPIVRFNYKLQLLYQNDSARMFMEDFGISTSGIEEIELNELAKEVIAEGIKSKNIFIEKNHRFYSIWLINVIENQYFNIYANDISLYVNELNRKEKELESKNTELEAIKGDLEISLAKETEINRMKSRFISMTSHEFRTPVTTIQANSELLEIFLENQALSNSKPAEKYLKRITTEVVRLTHLMNDILLMGRIESGRIPFKPVSTDVVALISEFRETHRFEDTDERRLQVTIHGESKPVSLDPFLFNHILTNLVSNAFKYSKGRPDPELTLNFKTSELELIVRDQGIGIPLADQPKIFDSFFRSSNVENIQGTGMGLAIVKQFIDLHEASFRLASVEHEGTTLFLGFKYELPKT